MPKLNLESTPAEQVQSLEEQAQNQPSYLSDDDVSIEFDESGHLQLKDNRSPEAKAQQDAVRVPQDRNGVDEGADDAPADPHEARFSKIEDLLNKTIDAVSKIATQGTSPKQAEVTADDTPSPEGLDLNDPKVFMDYLTKMVEHKVGKAINPYQAGFKEMDLKQQLGQVYQEFGQAVVEKANTDRMAVLISNNPGMTVKQAWLSIQAIDKIQGAAPAAPARTVTKADVAKKQQNLDLDSNKGVGGGVPAPTRNGKKMTIEQATEAAIAEVLGRS